MNKLEKICSTVALGGLTVATALDIYSSVSKNERGVYSLIPLACVVATIAATAKLAEEYDFIRRER